MKEDIQNWLNDSTRVLNRDTAWRRALPMLSVALRRVASLPKSCTSNALAHETQVEAFMVGLIVLPWGRGDGRTFIQGVHGERVVERAALMAGESRRDIRGRGFAG